MSDPEHPNGIFGQHLRSKVDPTVPWYGPLIRSPYTHDKRQAGRENLSGLALPLRLETRPSIEKILFRLEALGFDSSRISVLESKDSMKWGDCTRILPGNTLRCLLSEKALIPKLHRYAVQNSTSGRVSSWRPGDAPYSEGPHEPETQ